MAAQAAQTRGAEWPLMDFPRILVVVEQIFPGTDNCVCDGTVFLVDS